MKVLIVEDDLLIAESFKIYLAERSHDTIGIAISYDEALTYIDHHDLDVALLDIRLYGQKSGLDVAQYIQKQKPILPYIIVSSQYDKEYIKSATEVGASGYITKPISKETLWASLELAVIQKSIHPRPTYVDFKISHGLQRIKLFDIQYIKSDHVYVQIVGSTFKYHGRYTLREILDLIDQPQFVQCHRSYVVNVDQVDKFTTKLINFGDVQVPISHTYKKTVLEKLENR